MNKINRLVRYSIWVLAALFFFYEFFLRTLLASMLPDMIRSLHVNIEQLSMVDIAYCITYGAMQIPAGILIDRFGVKKVIVAAVFCTSLSIAIFSTAHGFYLAFCCRLLLGFGSSFAFICLLVITLEYLPKKYSGTFFGCAQFIGALGPLAAGAPLVLLLKLSHHQWRPLFLVISSLGFVISISLFILLTKNKTTQIPQTKKSSVSFKQIILLINNKQIQSLLTYSATIYTSLALLGTLWGTTYLKSHGIIASHASFIASMGWIGLAIASPLLGGISDILKTRKPILIFCALLGVITSIIIIYTPITSQFLLLCLFLSLGIASAGQSISFVLLADKVKKEMRGTILGLNNAVISIAIIAIIPLASFLIQHSLHIKSHPGSTLNHGDFMIGLAVMPVLFAISLVISIFTITQRTSLSLE